MVGNVFESSRVEEIQLQECSNLTVQQEMSVWNLSSELAQLRVTPSHVEESIDVGMSVLLGLRSWLNHCGTGEIGKTLNICFVESLRVSSMSNQSTASHMDYRGGFMIHISA